MRSVVSLLLCFSLASQVGAQTIDTCFVCSLIPDSVFARMQGKSYKASCPVPRSELRYLRLSYRDAHGQTQRGELICNQSIAQDLVSIFRQLWKADYRIERMQLIDDFDADDERSMDANNTSCFNYRTIAGSNVTSKHGRGLAIDINPLYNPCVKGKTIQPKRGRKWAFGRDRRKDIPYKIHRNDLCYLLFKEHGFRWGGDWRSLKDYQHFEK